MTHDIIVRTLRLPYYKTIRVDVTDLHQASCPWTSSSERTSFSGHEPLLPSLDNVTCSIVIISQNYIIMSSLDLVFVLLVKTVKIVLSEIWFNCSCVCHEGSLKKGSLYLKHGSSKVDRLFVNLYKRILNHAATIFSFWAVCIGWRGLPERRVPRPLGARSRFICKLSPPPRYCIRTGMFTNGASQ